MPLKKTRHNAFTSDKPIEAVFYARVSSEEQQDGFSLPAQIRAAEKYAAEHGLKVVERFSAAESAKEAGRKAFNAMCDLIKKSNKPMALLVEKEDRLFRNLPDWVLIEQLIKDKGLEVHYFKERAVLTKDSNSDQMFMHGIKVLMAKKYIDNLAEECKKGMYEKAAQGHWPQKAPLGYVNNPVTRRIDLDPDRAPIIRRLFERYATGEYSLNDLLDLARLEGLPKAASGHGAVSRSTIERILCNTFYYGEFEWPKGTGKVNVGKHEPIISRELFKKVQAVREGRAGGDIQTRTFAFTGILTCGYCGCQVTAEIKKNKYIYYHCTGRRGQCPKPNFREEEIEKLLGQTIAQLQLDDRVFETFRTAVKASVEDQERYHEDQVRHLRGEETRYRNRLHNLIMLKLDGDVGEDIYQQTKAKLEADLEKIEERLTAHAKADRKTMEQGVELLELAQTAYQSYMQRSADEKRQLLNFVCSNFKLTKEALVPTYRKPFDIIAFEAAAQKEKQAANHEDSATCLIKYPQRGSNPCYHLERVVS